MRLRLIILLVIVLAAVIVGAVLLREPVTCALFLRSVPANAIAFLRGDGVYLMNADGSTPCRVAEGPYVDVGWTPDGSQLTFANLDRELYFANPDGSNRRLVATGSTGDDRVPAYSLSPVSDDIAGLRRVEDRYEVVVYSAPGTEPTFIVLGLTAFAPVWSPDGVRLAFLSEPTALYVVNADGSGLRQMSDEAYPSMSPVWSVDSASVYFVNTRFEFVEAALDGTDTTTITDFNGEVGGQVFDYALSPDGRQMATAVLMHVPLGIDLYILDLTTHDARLLAQREDSHVTEPVWSPDGTLIYYRQPDDTPARLEDLYRIDVASGARARLTSGSDPAPRPYS